MNSKNEQKLFENKKIYLRVSLNSRLKGEIDTEILETHARTARTSFRLVTPVG